MAFLLNSLRPYGADLQKLVLLDYALVYSEDLGGPPSIHTPIPQRNSEVFARRHLIEQGLYLMSVKGVVAAEYADEGIVYLAGRNCRQLVQGFTSTYARQLELRADWVASEFGLVSTDALNHRFELEGRRWGAEFGDLLN